jgi:hypothetical protein
MDRFNFAYMTWTGSYEDIVNMLIMEWDQLGRSASGTGGAMDDERAIYRERALGFRAGEEVKGRNDHNGRSKIQKDVSNM